MSAANRPLTADDLPIDELYEALRNCFDVDFLATIAALNGCIAKELSVMSEGEWKGVVAVLVDNATTETPDKLNRSVNALLQWLRLQRKWGLE